MTTAPEVRVAHRDEWLAVVDKPAGLVVHPAPGTSGPTLVDLLGKILGGGEPERRGIVHRLDADTSGLLVVARTEQSHARLSEMVRARKLEREYVTLVEGHLSSRTGTIDAPIGRHHRVPERMAVSGRAAREARTHFEVIEFLHGASLVRVTLETGRTHQIRTHFAAIGHPVAGDSRYGCSTRFGLGRQFLHSRRLAFRHPFTGERLECESPLPEDLAAALEQARSG